MATGIGGETGWWAPSLDDTGNGTTTLYDLAGSNDGTLTNMDASTDWVADTANGGVRRLDFDTTSEHIVTSYSFAPGTGAFSVSLWFKMTTTVTVDSCLMSFGDNSAQKRFMVRCENGVIWGRYNVTSQSGGSGFNDGNWHHLVWRKGAGEDASDVDIFVDDTLLTLSTTTDGQLNFDTATIDVTLAKFNLSCLDGSLDDVRIFGSKELSDAEVAELYDSGNGRGYEPSSGVTFDVLNQNALLGGVLLKG